ncbi:MAG TPA: phosphate acetyltransferase [Kiritimatiellia bacterium]|nr:phosphate acetyltransferase [Kiritimatiellia bacterium]HPS09005.1 phosphate acetyltransferase [Kiritimatiellia bacterium]
MSILDSMIPRAKAAKKTIVLAEGMDPRVIAAAVKAKTLGICTPIVLGTPGEIAAAEAQAGVTLASAGLAAVDYTTSELLPRLASAFYEKRKAKGMTEAEAMATVKGKRLYFGNMMVALDLAQGLVAGSIASTGDMLRSAFHCVGTAKGIKLASSFFIMDLKKPTASGDTVLLFADCAVNICPTAEELVDIAYATAVSYQKMVGKKPKVAFLSFSTKGSASHELVDKVRTAAELTKKRFEEMKLDAVVDGEVQADAALVPSVGVAKNKGGAIQGDANVLIFPDIQAGNICYKLVQRLADATALGPVLQGLAKPVNDLSRGCSDDDIVGTMCINVLQS